MTAPFVNCNATSTNVYRAIAEDGKVVWQDADAPSAPWWSLSKTAIASAALVLAQRGRLYLDSAIQPYPFTIRQLLNHTSGLPDYGELADYHQAVRLGLPPWSQAELFQRVDAQRLRSTPGTKFLYSNVGYTVVRNLIEDATCLKLNDALNELVFRPLGLVDVRVASCRNDLGGNSRGFTAAYDPGWVFHGLVISTPSQAALFLNRLFGGEMLDHDHLQSMREPVIVSEHGFPNRPWTSAAYGLGLMIDLRSPLGPCCGHTGQGPGSTSATYRFDALPGGRTVAVFAATDDQSKVEREALMVAECKYRN